MISVDDRPLVNLVIVLVTSSVDEMLSVTADSGMSRNAEMRPRAGAQSPECGSGSGDHDRDNITGQ